MRQKRRRRKKTREQLKQRSRNSML